MIVPLAVVGVDAVDLDRKIELAFFKIIGIEKHIPGKIRKMPSHGGVNMFYFKQNT
jgi:hypothetical protein